MKPAFISFTVTVTLLMLATALTGTWVQGDRWFAQHFALGLMTTLFTCLCHCVVLIYFMATGKMMRLAVEDILLGPAAPADPSSSLATQDPDLRNAVSLKM